jgi:hypothetical protein
VSAHPPETGANGNAQNKRRRYNDRDDEKPKEEDPVDKLRGATTLYVGNLYVLPSKPQRNNLTDGSQVFLHH